MPHIKALFHFLDYVAATFLGLTILDTFSLFQDKLISFEQVKGTPFQFIYMLIGLGYFILNGYNTYQSKKLEREKNKLENEKLKEELEMLEFQNDEKKS